MAFASQEKADILYFLGYSGFEDDGPAMRAINSLDSREATMGSRIRSMLNELRKVEKQLSDSLPLALAIQDGSIQLRARYTIDTLRAEGRRHCANLGRWCKVSVCEDVFSEGGRVRNSANFYSGDPSERRINPDIGMPTRGKF